MVSYGVYVLGVTLTDGVPSLIRRHESWGGLICEHAYYIYIYINDNLKYLLFAEDINTIFCK